MLWAAELVEAPAEKVGGGGGSKVPNNTHARTHSEGERDFWSSIRDPSPWTLTALRAVRLHAKCGLVRERKKREGKTARACEQSVSSRDWKKRERVGV